MTYRLHTFFSGVSRLRTELCIGVWSRFTAENGIFSRVMNYQHLTRDGFKDIFKNVFGSPLSKETIEKLEEAKKTRDRVIHGKSVPDNELREAIANVLEYAELLNKLIAA